MGDGENRYIFSIGNLTVKRHIVLGPKSVAALENTLALPR